MILSTESSMTVQGKLWITVCDKVSFSMSTVKVEGGFHNTTVLESSEISI